MATERSPLTRLTHVASRQHGAFTRSQARWSGFSDRQIDLRIASGAFVVLRPGVLAIGGCPPTWEQVAISAVLASGPGAMAAGPTAARLWSLSPRPPSDLIHVLTPSTHRRTRRPGIVGHRSGIVDASDRARRKGIDITAPSRTLVDCAGLLGPDGLGAALDDGLRQGLLTLEAMRATTARLLAPGRPHRRIVVEVLADRLPGYDPGDSDLEVRSLTAIRRAGLPTPVQQHPIEVDGRVLHLDLAYPERLVAVELDGWEWHRHRTAFERDRTRVSWLAAMGWAVLVATSRTVETDLVPQLRALLASRQQQRLRPGA